MSHRRRDRREARQRERWHGPQKRKARPMDEIDRAEMDNQPSDAVLTAPHR
ncbi:hypothetical protein [Halochromatium glycolicum]|uniref:hypothetical protein n=1 Tax=Halochromatium glycolicum TaxID=85075 RepID=UPI00190C7A3C|nr:hypothetical protein [Halochromatium glycolicum]